MPSDPPTRSLLPDGSGATSVFLHVTPKLGEDGRARVHGIAVVPGLAICRVTVGADPMRITRGGPGRDALLAYVRAALAEDIVSELPWN